MAARNSTVEWRVSDAEFKGYVKAKLDDISDKLEKDEERLGEHDTKIGKLENDMTGMKVTSGLFGTLGGFAGGLLGVILKS